MSTETLPQAKLTTVASFPANYFLENLVVRADNSVLITALNHKVYGPQIKSSPH